MKHQQVSVDYWSMLKSMMMYGFLTVMGWIMIRLFSAVFRLPHRLRTQQENIQATLQEFQRRYPDLNVTEEDLINAEKELEEWKKDFNKKLDNDIKEKEEPNKEELNKEIEEKKEDSAKETVPAVEDKKSI